MQQHHAIYIPGLGDSKARGQDSAVNKWQKNGVIGHYYALGWADGEPFRPKLERLLLKIDELSAQGHLVSLVGASAGASAILNAYAKRPNIHAVVCINGKINNPESINQAIYDANPAFMDSIYEVSTNLSVFTPEQLQRIMSIHPIHDSYVPVKDTIIPGAVEQRVLTFGHAFGIFYTLVFKSKIITSFIKSLPKN